MCESARKDPCDLCLGHINLREAANNLDHPTRITTDATVHGRVRPKGSRFRFFFFRSTFPLPAVARNQDPISMGKSKSGDLEAQVPDHIQSRYTAAHECVSEEALAHLKTYKYSSVDKSYVSRYILKHYWNAFVEILPLWLAPNMVTLLGFFFILANVGLLELYVPDLVGPAPKWVYYSFAIGLWMYSTMDNVDGKQARRTGTSSGLGELFDHGIDSLNCTLASLLETAAMGYGATKTGAFTALIPCLPMFFSTWETYHTHTLYLGYFNGPTEGLIIACSMMIMSAQYGPEIWSSSLIRYFPSLENYISPLTTFREFWIPILLGSFFVAHLPACVVNVVKARRAHGLPVAPVFYEWTPIVVFTAATCAWLGSPYSFILEDWDSKQKTGGHLVLWCLIMSLVFGRMTTKIILAHLTRQPFPYWTVMLVPMIVGAIIVNLPFLGIGWKVTESFELWYLRTYFVFAAIVYAKWAVLVINSICAYLGINCLTIPRGRDSPAESEKTSLNSVEPERRVTRSMANGNGGRKSD